MFIIDDIWNWLASKILDRYFGKYFGEKNQEIIDIYEKRLVELKGKITELEGEHITFSKEKSRIIDSIKRRGISTRRLIEKYDKPLNAILISYASQVVKNNKNYYKPCKFIRDELMKFNCKGLGATDFIIPPTNVPKWINNQNDLKKWFEDEILKGRFCKIKFLVLFDIRTKAYWGNYVPYKQINSYHFTIGEVLNIEDVFSDSQLQRIALENLIRDGDISWLSSTVLTEKELDIINQNQKVIEKNMGNLNLREIAKETNVPKIEQALSAFITNPKDVSIKIHAEAKFWEDKLT